MKTFNSSPIALIDSGIGGLSLLKEIVKKFPNENYIYLADNLYAPYGNKSKKWLVARLNELIEYLYTNFNVKLVILACNTASSCIDSISKISPVKVVGLDLNSCAIGEYKILCTKLSAKNYTNLNTYACPRLASYIEDNIFNKKALSRYIKRVLNKAQINEQNIVLGCTHYELVANEFKALLPNKNFILPCNEFINTLRFSQSNINSPKGNILILSTLSTKAYIDKLWKIFKN
jgi:glutamate racemase